MPRRKSARSDLVADRWPLVTHLPLVKKMPEYQRRNPPQVVAVWCAIPLLHRWTLNESLECLVARVQEHLVLAIVSRDHEIPAQLVHRHVTRDITLTLGAGSMFLILAGVLRLVSVVRALGPAAAPPQQLSLMHAAVARSSALFTEEEAAWCEDRHDRVDLRSALAPASFLYWFWATVGACARRPGIIRRHLSQALTFSIRDTAVALTHRWKGPSGHGLVRSGVPNHRCRESRFCPT